PRAMATVVFDTAPEGAEIFGPDKISLGKTPAHLALPITDQPVTFELRLAGYHKKTKQLVVSGNVVVSVPLERVTPALAPSHPGSGQSNDSNGLMRPGDL